MPNHDEINLDNQGFHITLTPSKRKKISKVFLAIEGNLVIEAIARAKEAIAPALEKYDVISISLKNVTNIDVSGIQLLHYLSCSGKKVTIDSHLDDKHRSLISVAGFSSILHKSKLS